MEFFGLSDNDVPDYRIIKMQENMAKFKPDVKDLSTEAVKKFTSEVLTGSAKVTVRLIKMHFSGYLFFLH